MGQRRKYALEFNEPLCDAGARKVFENTNLIGSSTGTTTPTSNFYPSDTQTASFAATAMTRSAARRREWLWKASARRPSLTGHYPMIQVALLDGHFQILGRPERDFLACLDLDRFAGGGIAPHASRPLPDLQDAETHDADSLALLEMLGDQADEVAEQGFAGPLRQLMFLGQGGREMLEGHGTAGLGGSR